MNEVVVPACRPRTVVPGSKVHVLSDGYGPCAELRREPVAFGIVVDAYPAEAVAEPLSHGGGQARLERTPTTRQRAPGHRGRRGRNAPVGLEGRLRAFVTGPPAGGRGGLSLDEPHLLVSGRIGAGRPVTVGIARFADGGLVLDGSGAEQSLDGQITRHLWNHCSGEGRLSHCGTRLSRKRMGR